MGNLDKVSTASVRLLGRDRIAFRKLVVGWQGDLDDLAVSESEALNAAARLIIRSATPELLAEHAARKNMSEEETKRSEQLHDWFLKQFLATLQDVVAERNGMDARRKKNA
ncbi:hypothetical protein [Nocardia testacea]|uniref:hypothetical protein n=1 Tax=Nocardia testacea TaxID=248551 RepID=UPI0033ED8D42